MVDLKNMEDSKAFAKRNVVDVITYSNNFRHMYKHDITIMKVDKPVKVSIYNILLIY